MRWSAATPSARRCRSSVTMPGRRLRSWSFRSTTSSPSNRWACSAMPRNHMADDGNSERAPDPLAAFNEYRSLLYSIAYRMLGTVADAEDVLQDAFIRWQQAPRG